MLRVGLAVAARPWLWWAAVRQVFRLAPRGWWRRRPFLPVPSQDYLEFRLVTQYGGDPREARPDIATKDVLDYLRWCRDWNDGR